LFTYWSGVLHFSFVYGRIGRGNVDEEALSPGDEQQKLDEKQAVKMTLQMRNV
jgi:hypothetical protein